MKREENKLADLIAGLDRYRGFVGNFDSLIDFALFMFLANPTEEQRKHFEECRQKPAYLEAVQMLGELSEGYHDSLGDMFMERISHGANSQFFTPEHICDFMARIADGTGESVCDPTCGSGRFLLKALQQSREEHNREPTLYGCDLDHRCTRMTLLNLCLNSGRGDVEWGNSLSLEIFKTYHIDRVLVCGKWMSFVWQYSPRETDMEALNRERQQTIHTLLGMGILYERPLRQRERENEREDQPVAQAVEVEPVAPIEEPVRKPPVQLEFDF